MKNYLYTFSFFLSKTTLNKLLNNKILILGILSSMQFLTFNSTSTYAPKFSTLLYDASFTSLPITYPQKCLPSLPNQSGFVSSPKRNFPFNLWLK